MRVRIEHRTTFTYDVPAKSSFNEVRLTPRNDERQNVLDFALVTEPHARVTSYQDHFGTIVQAFNVAVPHEQLREHMVQRRANEAHADFGRPGGFALGHFARKLRLPQGPLRLAEKNPPGIGQLHAAPRAVEQLNPQIRLKPLD